MDFAVSLSQRLWVKAGKIIANKKQDAELRIIDRNLSMATN